MGLLDMLGGRNDEDPSDESLECDHAGCGATADAHGDEADAWMTVEVGPRTELAFCPRHAGRARAALGALLDQA